MALFAHLIGSLSYMLLAALALTAVLHRIEQFPLLKSIVVGFAFLAAGLCSMADPWMVGPEIRVDSRNTSAILAAAFGGPVGAFVADSIGWRW